MGSAGYRSSSGTGRYASLVGKGATYSALIARLKLLREPRYPRHHSITHQSTAEPSTRDGTRQRQPSKQIRVSAIGIGEWKGGP